MPNKLVVSKYTPLTATLMVLAVFLCLPLTARAESTALPDDVIESPAVKKADVGTHFKNVFGREASPGELKYWEIRLKDKPTEFYFLGAMAYWAEKGESPSVENTKFVLSLSGTGTDVFEGQTRRHTVTVSHTNPIAQSGYLDIKTNATDVNPTAPLPNTQRTEVSGITRLRHHYTLPPDTTLSVNFISTAPAPPQLTFEAMLPGRGQHKKHLTKVYEAVPTELAGTTYHEKQIPLMFARVFGRTPTEKELAYWRSHLKKTKRLDAIQGKMEVNKLSGKTMPGVVLGARSDRVAVPEINSLFRSVYGRSPSGAEWAYWAKRLTDKPRRPEYLGAMAFQKEHRHSSAVLGAKSNSVYRLELTDSNTTAAAGDIVTYNAIVKNIYTENTALTPQLSITAKDLEIPTVSHHGRRGALKSGKPGGTVDWNYSFDSNQKIKHEVRIDTNKSHTFTFQVKAPTTVGSEYCIKARLFPFLETEDCNTVVKATKKKIVPKATPAPTPAPKITSKEFRISGPDSLETDPDDQEITWHVTEAIQKKYPYAKIEICPGKDFKNCIILAAVVENDGSHKINMPPVPRIGRWYLHLIGRDSEEKLRPNVTAARLIVLHQ